MLCLGRCCCLLVVADVKAIIIYICIQADVIAFWLWQMLLPLIASLSVLLADGIAKMSLVFCNHQC